MALGEEPFLLPVRSDPMLMYYDRTVLRQYGLEEPGAHLAVSTAA